MGRIKSAWEIALEKTADIKVDLDKINRDKVIKHGSQIAGNYINNIDFSIEDFTKAYKNEENKEAIKEGIVNIILINITIPNNDLYKEKLQKLSDICNTVKPNDENIISFFEQLGSYYEQYLNHQKEFIDQMKEQFAPQLAQKQAQLQQQYGPDFVLQPEQDPEFMKLLNENLKKLEQQYNSVLTDVKTRIKEELMK